MSLEPSTQQNGIYQGDHLKVSIIHCPTLLCILGFINKE